MTSGVRDYLLVGSLFVVAGSIIYSAVEMAALAPSAAHLAEATALAFGAAIAAAGYAWSGDSSARIRVSILRRLLLLARTSWLSTSVFVTVGLAVALAAFRLGPGAVSTIEVACGGASQLTCRQPLTRPHLEACSQGSTAMVALWAPLKNADQLCQCRVADTYADVLPSLNGKPSFMCPAAPLGPSSPTPDELEVLNEWVGTVAMAPNYEQAKDLRSEFIAVYPKLRHEDRGGPIWLRDVRIVRDLRGAGFLIVIDMYPKASSRECLTFGIAELQIALRDRRNDTDYRDLANEIEKFLTQMSPLCYELKEFEDTFGSVRDETLVAQQRELGSCLTKITQKHPQRHCADDDE